jgi:hypothetical protein
MHYRTTRSLILAVAVAVTVTACESAIAPVAPPRAVPKVATPDLIGTVDVMLTADTAIKCAAIGGCSNLSFVEYGDMMYWANEVLNNPNPFYPIECRWNAAAVKSMLDTPNAIKKAPNYNPAVHGTVYQNSLALFEPDDEVMILMPLHFTKPFEDRAKTFFHEGYHKRGYASIYNPYYLQYEYEAEAQAQWCASFN